jgi:hypothetical protein
VRGVDDEVIFYWDAQEEKGSIFYHRTMKKRILSQSVSVVERGNR